MLELNGPICQVLNLVEEEMGWLARVRGLVEGLAEDLGFVPIHDAQNRLFEIGEGREVIALHPQDATRRRACSQKIVDDLELGCRLADLPRPADHDDRRQSLLESLVDRGHEIPAHRRKWLGWEAFPPWVVAPQIPDEPFGKEEHR